MAVIPLENQEALSAARTRPEALLLDDGRDVTLWTAEGADTADLTSEDQHVLGTKSLQFSKTGVTVTVAGISRSLPQLDASNFGPDAVLQLVMSIPSLTDLASVEVRLGTDVNNYASFVFADSEFTAAVWDRLTKELAEQGVAGQVGTGLDLSKIEYLEIVVNFDANANTLVDIHVDSVMLRAA